MKRTTVVFAILFTTTVALTTNARATATYDGTLSGSISIAGCSLGGPILQSCVQSGLVLFGAAASSSPVTIIGGTGTATATQTVTAFGTGTDTVIDGTTFRTGMDGGSGFSITSLISGSASAPGSSAASLTFPSPTIFARNTTSGDVTLFIDYSFLYANTIAIDSPVTETAFSFSEFDLNRIDSLLGIPFDFQDLFESSCSNINPPLFGLTPDPCADAGSGRLTLLVDGCPNPACSDFRVTSVGLDGNQIGLASVVPEPGALMLFGLGLVQLGLQSWRRRRTALIEG